MALETFARQSLAQFIIIYGEIFDDKVIKPSDLEHLMWGRMCAKEANINKLGFKIPYDNIRRSKVTLPYLPDDINYTGCSAIKKNGGLYTPCCGKIAEDAYYCKTCSLDKEGEVKELEFGDVESRNRNVEDERFAPITFGEWMKGHKMTLTEVYAKLAAAGVGIEIPADQLMCRELPKRRKGRPAKSEDSVVDEDTVKPKRKAKKAGSDSEEPKAKKASPAASESDTEKKKAKKAKASPAASESDAEKPKKKTKKVPEPEPEPEPESESEEETPPKKASPKASPKPSPKASPKPSPKASPKPSPKASPAASESETEKPKKKASPKASPAASESETEKPKKATKKAPESESEEAPAPKKAAKADKAKEPKAKATKEPKKAAKEPKADKADKAKAEKPKKKPKAESDSEDDEPQSKPTKAFKAETLEIDLEQLAAGFDEDEDNDDVEAEIDGTDYIIRNDKYVCSKEDGTILGTVDGDEVVWNSEKR